MDLSDGTRTLLFYLLDQTAHLTRELGLPDVDALRVARRELGDVPPRESGFELIVRGAPSPSLFRLRDAQIQDYFAPALVTRDYKTRLDLHCPATVRLAFRAHETILRVLKRHRATYTGGCRAFQTPAEWIALGNRAPGPLAVLVVVYDGGELPDFFRLGVHQRRHEAMRAALSAAGLLAEEITGCCSALYPVEAPAAKEGN